MIYGLYAMRDERTGFLTPVPELSEASAVRNFYHTIQNSDGVLFSFAQDFRLYHLAEFDSETGLIEPIQPIRFVASGSDAKVALKQEVPNA